jgi:hypothetical protein
LWNANANRMQDPALSPFMTFAPPQKSVTRGSLHWREGERLNFLAHAAPRVMSERIAFKSFERTDGRPERARTVDLHRVKVAL